MKPAQFSKVYLDNPSSSTQHPMHYNSEESYLASQIPAAIFKGIS